MNEHPRPPFPQQSQPMPGRTPAMDPVPDHGEKSYRGSGRLAGKKAIITGADSGIGRAVAIAYAREGADIVIVYLSEHDDAKETQRLVEETGRKALLVAGDIQSSQHCRTIVEKAVNELGSIDILVNNAAHQATFKSIEDISDEEWELTFKVNIHAMFYLTKAAVPHMKSGSAIINTRSEERRVGKECRSLCDWSSDVCSSDLERSSRRLSMNSAASTSSSTMQRTRRRSNRSRTSPTRNGSSPSRSTSMRCSI